MRDVAEMIGLSIPFVHSVEAGKRRLRDNDILKLPMGDLRSALVKARAREYRASAREITDEAKK